MARVLRDGQGSAGVAEGSRVALMRVTRPPPRARTISRPLSRALPLADCAMARVALREALKGET